MNREVETHFSAGRDDDLLRRILKVVLTRELFAHRTFGGRQSRRGLGISRMTRLDGFVGRSLDMVRRVEVRFPGAEVIIPAGVSLLSTGRRTTGLLSAFSGKGR